MIFYISNELRRSLGSTGVLHVSDMCATMGKDDRTAWEATPREMKDAYTLCGVCAPRATGQERPDGDAG